MGRMEKMEKGAREAGVLPQDESVEQMTLAKWGLHSEAEFKGAAATAIKQNRCALLATPSKLYGVKLGQIGFSSIKEKLLELPIGEAQIERSHGRIEVGRKGEKPLWTFALMPYFSGATKLIAYVEARQQG
jgi:hypothetical protein